MRYRLVFDRKYKVPGRHTVAMIGSLVVFQDGVATVSSRDIAEHAKKLRFISNVQELAEPTQVVVSPPVKKEIEEVLATEEAITKALDEVAEAFSEEGESAEVESIEDADEDDSLTAEEIQELYDTHGTWSAVANHLGITTTTLRKYREEAGLL